LTYKWTNKTSLLHLGLKETNLHLDSSGNLETVEMRCWRRLKKISWADHVENKEVTTVKGERRKGQPTGMVTSCV
jgi:hypothetical protein